MKTDENEVEDNNRLFDHGVEGETQIYNYAPTVFEEDGVRHIYYCSNKYEGNVTDYVAYRKGTLVKGKWVYSELSFVLEPTQDTWDARHVCDPSVIKGDFNYDGDDYNYLMAYLGCVTSNNQENMVGLAVSKSPEGPWIKTEKVNPIAKYERDMSIDDIFQWGYGQPSLINSDKKSEVLLYYTVGD